MPSQISTGFDAALELFCLTQFDLLRPTTNRISDVRFCEGFAENGCPVRLIAPVVRRRENIPLQSFWECYGVTSRFDVHHVKTPFREDTSRWLRIPYFSAATALLLLRHRRRRPHPGARLILVSRHETTLLWARKVARILRSPNVRTVFWAHDLRPHLSIFRAVARSADGFLATNSAIRDDLCKAVQIPPSRVALTYNPVSSRLCRLRVDRKTARARLRLSPAQPLVVYTGKVGTGVQEISYILDAAQLLPQCDFLLTGGRDDAIRHFRTECVRRRLANVTFAGFIPNPEDVTYYQYAADVLVSYYTHLDHQVDYNYPQKITEYMLTGNPIVTPDFRATRDVLDSNSAFFVSPDNPPSFAQGIIQALHSPEEASRRANSARALAMTLSYTSVAERLLDFFRKLP